jgi:hypothetical protein
MGKKRFVEVALELTLKQGGYIHAKTLDLISVPLSSSAMRVQEGHVSFSADWYLTVSCNSLWL